jgi:hypothetical protein
MISFWAIKIDIKCKHLSNFPAVTLWALFKDVFVYFYVHLLIKYYYSEYSLCGHLYNDWFQSISMLTTNITFCWRTMHICQYIHVSFVFPCNSCQVTFHTSLHITLFQSEFPSKVLGIAFQFGLTVQQRFMAFICNSLNKSGEENIVLAEFLSKISNPCSKFWQSCMNCHHCSSHMFLVSV